MAAIVIAVVALVGSVGSGALVVYGRLLEQERTDRKEALRALADIASP